MHIASVLSGLDAGNVNTVSKIRLLGLGTCACRGVKNDDFSMFGDLGGDFCKETHEPKMFGMHIRSVLSGLHTENVNTDPEMSIQFIFGVGKVCVRESRFFEVWRPRRGLKKGHT